MVKKSKIVATVATLLIAAAGVITIQSCKKEQNNLLNTQAIIQKSIRHPQKIEDMAAYLKGFGEKMLNSKDNETLTMEEASWHLTAYQNFMYGDVNDYYTDIVYDEKEYTVPVSNGMVTLSDLGLLYKATAKDIVKFYQG